MKKILILILLFLSTHAFSQKITVLYLNTPWNVRNDYQDLDKLYGADILKVNYEDQADISMKLKVRYEKVQEVIDNAKAPVRRASTN